MEPPTPSYRPRAFYLRQEIKAARTVGQAQEAGFDAVAELEALLTWVRAQGLVPPKERPSEAEMRDNPRWARMG